MTVPAVLKILSFKQLPFAPNKGEALVADIPGLPDKHIYKKGMMIVPMAEKDLFWIGASYIWDFENADPTADFRRKHRTSFKRMAENSFRNR